MALQMLRFRAIDEAKKSSAKKLQVRRAVAEKVVPPKAGTKPSALKGAKRSKITVGKAESSL
jgi:hypothetical protein